MQIAEDIETGKDYLWKTSDPWDWFGKQCWWEVSVEFIGLNGDGGMWLIEKWRWNNSTEILREFTRSLSSIEIDALFIEIRHRQSFQMACEV